ncbi:hypothetical protein KDH_61130 [Dictyobacter sp. S3.2.2.5]|uniref:DUF5666 domain-containing protein n=1 Tax=Dictyobacter halimunensis TaxID=3026934 RepID=A0ABQ6FYB4_9CHLR|nr:hypothetical protein KDH_61130 [Dictyobacter sp. S3.2.2.5]
MATFTSRDTKNTFIAGELVTWRAQNGNEKIPVPAVVLRQKEDTVTIKARVQGKVQLLDVDVSQLTSR